MSNKNFVTKDFLGGEGGINFLALDTPKYQMSGLEPSKNFCVVVLMAGVKLGF